MSDTSNLRPGEVVRGIPVHDPLLDGRARDRVDRFSSDYKLGYCISALEGIISEARHAAGGTVEMERIVRYAHAVLDRIGHGVKESK